MRKEGMRKEGSKERGENPCRVKGVTRVKEDKLWIM